MSFLSKIFKKQEEPIRSYDDFWKWFLKNANTYQQVVKSNQHITRDFFDQLSPKLGELKDGFWHLTGMYDDNTAELIFTADGVIKNIVFVEELVAAAPVIKGWKFTELKPELDINNVGIRMDGYTFTADNLHFVTNVHEEYPDEVDICIVHDDYKEENKPVITNGAYIFLDNFLGELDFVVTVDSIRVTGRDQVTEDLIPIHKLKDYLKWRQKEFVEKYEATRRDTLPIILPFLKQHYRMDQYI